MNPSARALSCLAAAVCLAGTAPALARDVYECEFPQTANNLGYLAPLVYVTPEPDGQTAQVVDGFIQEIKGGPITVEIASQSDSKLVVAWTIMLQGMNNDYVKMHYRMTIQKQALTASLSGRPLAYSNNFNAQGKCKRKKG